MNHTIIVEIPIKEIETLFKIVPIYDLYEKTNCKLEQDNTTQQYNYIDSKDMKRLRALYNRLDRKIKEI